MPVFRRLRSIARPLALVAAAVAVTAVTGPAVGQGATPPPFQKSGDRPKPTPQPPTIRDNDPVLVKIRDGVKPTAAEMEAVKALFTELRQAQQTLSKEVREKIRATHPGGAGIRKDRKARMEMLAESRKAVHEALAPLNAEFVVEVTSKLDAARRPAWKTLAATLDLNPNAYPPSRRPELAWRDPARGPKVGDAAPEFTLKDLDGNPVSLASLRDMPVVLEFASLSDPRFRRTLPDAEKLQQAGGYQGTVRWVLVYTLEAHPSDGWALKQNEKKGIEIPQHETYEERVAAAKRLAAQLAPEWTLLVDDMKNTVATTYSGHPNRCFVIAPDGTILSRQIWFSSKDTLAGLYGYFDGLRRGRATGGQTN